MIPLADWARSITLGNAALFRFWFSYLLEPFRSLPVELYDEQALAQRMAKGEAFDLTLPASYPKLYASGLSKLNAYIGSLCHGVPAEPMTKQYLFWLARGTTVVAACCGSFASLLLASLLQFLFLPYSTFVAIAYGLETVFTLYTGHALVFPLLSLAVRAALPPWLNPTLTLDARFLALFLLVDHAFCAVCLGWTPKGTPKPVPTRRVLASMAYGFLNCKTYYLVLLPACFGLELELLPWLLDASLGLSARVSGHLERYWQVHFYHIHRMGHITNVYNDAHKFHHYLHDCTPFDAHIFGSGAPEEWLILMSDLALGLGFGLQPASLSGHVLGVSWYNKWGFHSRSDKPALHGDNFHADHHLRHSVNFGYAYPLELVMDTAPKELKGVVEWDGYRMEKVEEEGTVTLRFTPCATAEKALNKTPCK